LVKMIWKKWCPGVSLSWTPKTRQLVKVEPCP
jgi:hypothetical protein